MRRLPLLLLLTAGPVHAQADVDEQLWTSATATTALSRDTDATLEIHSRYFDGVSRLGQLLVRPSVTYKLSRRLSVAAGYVYARTRPGDGRANDEHRSWEQLGYTLLRREDGLSIGGRTRLEQRFRPDSSGVGWRVRQHVRMQSPVISNGGVRVVVWNETFIGLNDTRWGARNGVDQVRTFIGLNLPVRKNITVEPGYFNQTVFRRGRDAVNHAAAAHLTVRL